MQKINSSLKYFYFEPSIKDDVFLQKSIITQRKDYFLDFTKKTLGVGKNVNNKINLSDYVLRFYDISFELKIGRNFYNLKLSQIVASAMIMVGSILILRGL